MMTNLGEGRWIDTAKIYNFECDYEEGTWCADLDLGHGVTEQQRGCSVDQIHRIEKAIVDWNKVIKRQLGVIDEVS